MLTLEWVCQPASVLDILHSHWGKRPLAAWHSIADDLIPFCNGDKRDRIMICCVSCHPACNSYVVLTCIIVCLINNSATKMLSVSHPDHPQQTRGPQLTSLPHRPLTVSSSWTHGLAGQQLCEKDVACFRSWPSTANRRPPKDQPPSLSSCCTVRPSPPTTGWRSTLFSCWLPGATALWP